MAFGVAATSTPTSEAAGRQSFYHIMERKGATKLVSSNDARWLTSPKLTVPNLAPYFEELKDIFDRISRIEDIEDLGRFFKFSDIETAENFAKRILPLGFFTVGDQRKTLPLPVLKASNSDEGYECRLTYPEASKLLANLSQLEGASPFMHFNAETAGQLSRTLETKTSDFDKRYGTRNSVFYPIMDDLKTLKNALEVFSRGGSLFALSERVEKTQARGPGAYNKPVSVYRIFHHAFDPTTSHFKQLSKDKDEAKKLKPTNHDNTNSHSELFLNTLKVVNRIKTYERVTYKWSWSLVRGLQRERISPNLLGTGYRKASIADLWVATDPSFDDLPNLNRDPEDKKLIGALREEYRDVFERLLDFSGIDAEKRAAMLEQAKSDMTCLVENFDKRLRSEEYKEAEQKLESRRY